MSREVPVEDPVWRQSAEVLTRRTPRSVLLLMPMSSEPLKLEGAAIFVWDELQRPATDEGLVASIAARFAVIADEVRGDVTSIRAALALAGAVVGTDA